MKIIIFILIILTAKIFAQEWQVNGTMLRPIAGGSEWIDNPNGDIYIFGGYSDSTQADVNWVQKYNIFNNTWELDFMKEPRTGLIVGEYQNKKYLFGGIRKESEDLQSLEIWVNTDENLVKSSNINFNRVYSMGLIYKYNLYIIGGNPVIDSKDSLPYIVEYNLTTDSTTYMSDSLFMDSDLPEQQMSARVGDDIYIFGGVINGVSNKIYKFNTVDKSYTRVPIDLLEPRAAGRAIIGRNPNIIYIIGGYNESETALNSVEVFTIYNENYDIQKLAPLNIARKHFSVAYINEGFIIFGGYNSNQEVINEIELYYNYATTTVEEESDVIQNFQLNQNYPNPFNPTTTIQYTIPVGIRNDFPHQYVELKVYNILGKEIAELVNKVQNPGRYKVKFDASKLPSGVYYYRLTSGSFTQTKAMLLLK